MRSLTVLLLALLFLPLKATPAEIRIADAIEAIPNYITEIYQCGRWKVAASEGYFRVIYVDFYFGNSLLYVQWVKDTISPTGPTREVVKTLSITEFNANDHIEFMFKKPKCLTTKGGIKFNIIADSGHDEKTHRFKLKFFSEPGRHSISHAEAMPSRRK